MLTKLLATLHLSDPASLKRALTAAISSVVLLAINPVLAKWQIPPVSDAVIASVAGVVALFILQSGLKSGAVSVASLLSPSAGSTSAKSPDITNSTKPDTVKPSDTSVASTPAA